MRGGVTSIAASPVRINPLIIGRADVLDIPRPAPGRMDDLHRRRTDVVFTFARTGESGPPCGPGLVRNPSKREQRNPRSATRRDGQGETMAEVR